MKMFIRILSLSLVIMFALSPLSVSASEVQSATENRIDYADGSYVTITITQSPSRASYVQTGTKTLTYTDANGEVSWVAVLSGSFLFDGTTASCTGGICQVTIYESDWVEVSNSTTRSGATATTELTMGLKGLFGITIKKLNYTITLTCDKNGNLS